MRLTTMIRMVLGIAAIALLLWGGGGNAPASPLMGGRQASPVTRAPTPTADRQPPLSLAGERRNTFADFIAESMDTLQVPGAAVVVVQEGDIVFLEGYGVREAGGAAPVTPDTLMEIGSITKPLTALLAASLVDDGILSWETPVRDLLPGFTTTDPALTETLTIADLLCNCSGLPSRDLPVFFNADRLDPAALIASLAETAPTAAPGEAFQYSNQVYAVGGYAAAAAAGAAPAELRDAYRLAMQDRVLLPAGMAGSTFDSGAVIASGDYALPHGIDLDGQTVPLSLLLQQRPMAAVDPAAGLWSSARDLGAILQTLLANGVAPDGTRVVSPEGLAHVWEEHISLRPEEAAFIGAEGYGLGWLINEVEGQRLLGHTGTTPGFGATMAVLPAADLGFAILTNSGAGGSLAFAVQQRLFELLLNAPATAELDVERTAALIEANLAGTRALVGPLDLEAVTLYLGTYMSPDLGEVVLRLRDGRLVFDAGEVRSEMRPLRTRPDPDPRYVLTDPGAVGPGTPLVLRRDAAGRPEIVVAPPPIAALAENPIDQPPTYVFIRVGTAPAATPAR